MYRSHLLFKGTMFRTTINPLSVTCRKFCSHCSFHSFPPSAVRVYFSRVSSDLRFVLVQLCCSRMVSEIKFVRICSWWTSACFVCNYWMHCWESWGSIWTDMGGISQLTVAVFNADLKSCRSCFSADTIVWLHDVDTIRLLLSTILFRNHYGWLVVWFLLSTFYSHQDSFNLQCNRHQTSKWFLELD